MKIRADELEESAARWAVRQAEGLKQEERAELGRWLRADPRHYAALAEAELALSVLSPPTRTQDREWLRRDLAVWEERQRHRRRWGRRVAFASAGLAAAAALAVVVRLESGRLKPGPPTASGVGTMTVWPLARSLPDGSVVELNAGADLAAAYSPARRDVRLLKGEAHFAVAKDPARPFVVSVGGVEVRAVGTAFNVRFEPAAVQVLVTEGQVAVDAAPGNRHRADVIAAPASTREQRPSGMPAWAPSEPRLPAPASVGSLPAKRHDGPLLLAAGERVVVPLIAQNESLPVVSAVSAEEIQRALAWRQARLELNETTLEEAVARFNRQGRVQFAIGDAALKARRLSGICSTENATQFAELLAATLDIRIVQETPERIVLRKR